MEAYLFGSVDEQELIVVANSSGTAYVAGEVVNIQNAQSKDVAYVIQEAIANGASGPALMLGEIDALALSTSTFGVGDDVYWKTAQNYAITRTNAKTGDFYIGMCTRVKTSGQVNVILRLNHCLCSNPLSVSASSSSASVSTSSSSDSTSVSSVSSVSVSKASKSSSSISSASTSSNSGSSSSSNESISSNSDSSTSSNSSSSTSVSKI